jgi:hypothetical protein
MHKVANKHEDAQFCDYIEGEYLKEQVKSSSTYFRWVFYIFVITLKKALLKKYHKILNFKWHKFLKLQLI